MASQATLTPDDVCSALVDNITANQIETCKENKGLGLINYQYHKSFCNVDRDAIYRYRFLLEALMKKSSILQKSVLEKGFALYNYRLGKFMKDSRAEAYAVKKMQIDVSRIKSNMRTGTRMPLWLVDLTSYCDGLAEPEEVDDEAPPAPEAQPALKKAFLLKTPKHFEFMNQIPYDIVDISKLPAKL